MGAFTRRAATLGISLNPSMQSSSRTTCSAAMRWAAARVRGGAFHQQPYLGEAHVYQPRAEPVLPRTQHRSQRQYRLPLFTRPSQPIAGSTSAGRSAAIRPIRPVGVALRFFLIRGNTTSRACWTAPGSLEAVTSGKVGAHGIQEAASR
jgi:hypothetical protein